MNRFVLLGSAFSLLLFGSCATPPPTKSAKPSRTGTLPQSKPGKSTSRAEENELREIQSLFSRGAHERALQKVTAFKSRFPQSMSLYQVENIHGLILLATKNPAQAIVHFQNSIADPNSTPNFSQYVMYNLASAQFEANQLSDAQKTLDQIRPDVLDPDNRLKFFHLKSETELKRGEAMASVGSALAASKLVSAAALPKIRENYPALVALLNQALLEVNNTLALEQLYHDFEDAPLGDMVLFRLISQEVNQNNLQKGETYLAELGKRFPQSPLYPPAADLIHMGQSQAQVDTAAIGVLLPLKGKFAKFGARSLQGIELAFNIFNTSEPESKFTLVIEDSGDEPDQAIKALNRLVFKHHVIAVIGPLLSKGIEQVTQRANELHVPMISLARNMGAPSDYVIQGGLTLKLQAQEMARYAIQTLGVKKFAMVLPRDKIGDETGRHFWDAVESFGGEIVGSESYNPGETDFRQPVDKLSGLYYTEARQRELDALTKKREEENIRRRTRKTEHYFSLKPIVDYEAVFIPDEPKVSGQIIPTFAYRDVDKIRFLGTAAWNSPEFTTRAQNYAENALFVDAFHLESTAPHVRQFLDKYKLTYEQDPSEMEALSYDAARVLENSLSKGTFGEGTARNELLDRLKSTRSFQGVTGQISFVEGQLTRDLKLFTVQGGKIVLASQNGNR